MTIFGWAKSSLSSPLLRVPSQGLINKDTGAPQEMAGLATHLHYHEPSNFVLVSFLQRGLFHEFCEPDENGKKAIVFKSVWRGPLEGQSTQCIIILLGYDYAFHRRVTY